MANKESFKMYQAYRKVFERLSSEQVKRVLLAMFDYDLTGDVPDFSDDDILEIGTTLIFNQMRLDLIKWQKKVEVARDNGKKGGAPLGNQNARKNNQEQPNRLNLTELVEKQPKQPKQAEKRKEKKEKGKEKGKGKSFSPSPDPRELTSRVIEYFNNVAGTEFNAEDDSYVDLVKEHIAKGHTFEQMQKVIDRKVSEWSDGNNTNDMTGNINPLTILNIKRFDAYLNSPSQNDIEDNKLLELDEKIQALVAEQAVLEEEHGKNVYKMDEYLINQSRLESFEKRRRMMLHNSKTEKTLEEWANEHR